MARICWLGAATQTGEIQGESFSVSTLSTLLNRFSSSGPTDQTTRLICIHDRSNDAVWPRKFLLGVAFTKLRLVVSKYPNAPFSSSECSVYSQINYLE